MAGKITLTRYKGSRRTVLVDGFEPASLGCNQSVAGFTIPMQDGSELTVQLDRELIADLARTMKLIS